MGAAQPFQETEQGFSVVGLRTANAELRMVPSLGGRIIGLRNLRSGREWCWHQDRADWLWANQAGDDFGKSPQAGIDECVPTVGDCIVKGRTIPDHGEVWYRNWTLDETALQQGILSSTLALETSPFTFTRSIETTEEGHFRFRYRLVNTGSEAEPYLWCFHPLFTIQDGDRLHLPAEVRSLRLNGGIGTPIEFGDTWNYPEPFPGIRIDDLMVPGMPGGCVKGFSGQISTGKAGIENPTTGDRLELHWDARQVPYLGLWLNRGFVGFHHVALEPTSGAPDSLSDAIELWEQHAILEPGSSADWYLEIKIF